MPDTNIGCSEALGPLADDAEAMDVLGAAMQPRFFELVGAGHRSPEETARLVAEALTPWLERRQALAGEPRRRG